MSRCDAPPLMYSCQNNGPESDQASDENTSFQVKQRPEDTLNKTMRHNQPRPEGRKFPTRNHLNSSGNNRYKTTKGGKICIAGKTCKSILVKYNV